AFLRCCVFSWNEATLLRQPVDHLTGAMRFAGQAHSYEESIRKKARSTSCGLTFGVLCVTRQSCRRQTTSVRNRGPLPQRPTLERYRRYRLLREKCQHRG